jgi:hypothetical protein
VPSIEQAPRPVAPAWSSRHAVSAADRPVLELLPGDRVRLRKPHPCGGRTWRVTRLGADIGLVCDTCGRRVMLERRDLERRFTGFVERAAEAKAAETAAAPAAPQGSPPAER